MRYRHQMEIEALRWFQRVADGDTVTEVGASEFITQSGVSRALARLEAEVGTPLLQRQGRVLRTTRAGAAFQRHVDTLLHQWDDALAAVEQLVDPETGTVVVAFQLSLGTWLVPRLISSFRESHPGVGFELMQLTDEPAASQLAQGRVDLEISTVRPTDRDVQWHRLLVEPLSLAVPRSHYLAQRSEVTLAEVSTTPFITLRSASLLRQQTESLCAQAGFRLIPAFEGADIPTLRGFVSAGLGVAVVPAVHRGSPDAASGAVHHLRITDPGAFREIGLGWATDRRVLPAAELFRRHVVHRAAVGDWSADRAGLSGS